MDAFIYDALPGRVVFAAGALDQVGEHARSLGASRFMLIADANAQAIGDSIAQQLGDAVALRWNEAIQHVPVELAARARDAATAAGIDAIVCTGGGSATGLAKIVALSHGVPIVAVPTTYAGSEMTPIYGSTGGAHKEVGRNLVVLPKVVVYDPLLTLGLPAGVTGPSAFNALAHCVEALYAPGCNPVTSVLALEGVRAIARSLPWVMHDLSNVEARGELLYGAYLAGGALGATATGMHHKICHVLGGTFNLVHADSHSVVLPHAVAYNRAALPVDMARLAAALGVPDADPAGALWDLAAASDVPTSLAQLGMPQDGIDEATDRALKEITVNPAPVTREGIRALLVAAYAGTRPSAS